jgi:hypothetical protein
MGNSRINCKNIKKPNCVFYTEGRFCPNPCEGFIQVIPASVPIATVNPTIVSIDMEYSKKKSR